MIGGRERPDDSAYLQGFEGEGRRKGYRLVSGSLRMYHIHTTLTASMIKQELLKVPRARE